MTDRFRDRRHAGRVLADRLTHHADADAIILALPRGGVPVAFEIANALRAELDIFVIRKLGVPGHEELAMGAIAAGGTRVLNDDVVQGTGTTERDIAAVAAQETKELQRREKLYRGERGPIQIEGRNVILVDDGLATGATMRAAVMAVRAQDPKRVVVAVPVGAPETCTELQGEADEVVCALTPETLSALSLWYGDFSQTSDDEVRRLLEEASSARAGAANR